jgi:ribonucleoside-triphosphate reductase
MPDWQATAKLVKTISENYKLPYYTISPTYSICTNHGYLAGEQFICPYCGETAEVYSRITGYYRPVRHWNDGKAEEYNDRRTYGLEACQVEQENFQEAAKHAVDEHRMILITSKNCPNCHVAKKYLENHVIEILEAEENAELVQQYQIRTAPTLLVLEGNDHKVCMGLSGIRKHIETNLTHEDKMVV